MMGRNCICSQNLNINYISLRKISKRLRNVNRVVFSDCKEAVIPSSLLIDFDFLPNNAKS